MTLGDQWQDYAGRDKRLAINRFVRQYWLAHGYGPDVRTITRELDLSSTSVTDYHIADPGEGR